MSRFITTMITLILATSVSTAQEVNRKVEKRRSLPPGHDALVKSLIDSGIAIAKEIDPLKKAGHFEGIAEHLARAAERASKARYHTHVAKLAEQFSKVAEKGVFGNVKKSQDKGGKGLENAIQIHLERMGRHEEVLRRVLAKAPKAAHKGLLRALEVSKRGRLNALERLQRNRAKQEQKRAGKGGSKPGKGGGKGR